MRMRRACAMLLCVALAWSLLPAGALAEAVGAEAVGEAVPDVAAADGDDATGEELLEEPDAGDAAGGDLEAADDLFEEEAVTEVAPDGESFEGGEAPDVDAIVEDEPAEVGLVAQDDADGGDAGSAVTEKAVITSVAAPGDQAYTGGEVRPTPVVKCGGQMLVLGTDYTLSYKSNTKVGTATVTATGTGNYRGTKSATFRIVAPTARYKVHRQTYGWEKAWLADGQVSGTTGESKRLEGDSSQAWLQVPRLRWHHLSRARADLRLAGLGRRRGAIRHHRRVQAP